MIKPGEIQKRAREAGVRDQQIEKDYILSWVLQGIAKHESLAKSLVFKGGTALKKVFFKDYRFSEDLDFTLIDDAVSNDQIVEWFDVAFEYIVEEANIPLDIVDHSEYINGSINFFISYIGPLGGQGKNKRLKVDISRGEKLVFQTIKRDVILSYSDQLDHQLLCYPIEEVLVEKLRSVIQRMQARDFYDIWYLLEIQGMDIGFFIEEFRSKCDEQDLNPSDFHHKLKQRLPQYKGRWSKSLADQVQNLPDFERVEREVMRQIKRFEP